MACKRARLVSWLGSAQGISLESAFQNKPYIYSRETFWLLISLFQRETCVSVPENLKNQTNPRAAEKLEFLHPTGFLMCHRPKAIPLAR